MRQLANWLICILGIGGAIASPFLLDFPISVLFAIPLGYAGGSAAAEIM